MGKVSKKEFIADFMAWTEHELERFLPSSAKDYKMLEKTKEIIDRDIAHIQKEMRFMNINGECYGKQNME